MLTTSSQGSVRRAVIARISLVFGSFLIVACDSPAPSTTAPSAPARPLETASAKPAPTVAPSSSASSDQSSIQLLRFAWTSGVTSKEPVDTLKVAEPGQKIFAHLTLRNRTDKDRTITLIFRVGGDERSTVPLKVDRSWSWRTWGYTTLRANDSGEVRVEIVDEGGAVIATESLSIKKPASAKP